MYYTTIEEYLAGCVNMPVDKQAIANVLLDRKVVSGSVVSSLERRDVDLCKADLYRWIATGPSRLGAVSDSDNGWSHSEGGFSLSSADRAFLIREANRIYAMYGETPIGGNVVRVKNYGIKPRNYFGGNCDYFVPCEGIPVEQAATSQTEQDDCSCGC